MKKLVMALVMMSALGMASIQANLYELSMKKEQLTRSLNAHKELLSQEKRANSSSKNIANLQSVIKELENEIAKLDKQFNQELTSGELSAF